MIIMKTVCVCAKKTVAEVARTGKLKLMDRPERQTEMTNVLSAFVLVFQ